MIIPPPHTQEIVFNNKTKITLHNVEKIEAGNWFHIVANGGKEYIINPDNILYTKVYRDGQPTDYEIRNKKSKII